MKQANRPSGHRAIRLSGHQAIRPSGRRVISRRDALGAVPVLIAGFSAASCGYALADPNVQAHIAGKTVRKVVIVKSRLVSIVV